MKPHFPHLFACDCANVSHMRTALRAASFAIGVFARVMRRVVGAIEELYTRTACSLPSGMLSDTKPRHTPAELRRITRAPSTRCAASPSCSITRTHGLGFRPRGEPPCRQDGLIIVRDGKIAALYVSSTDAAIA